MDFGQNGHNIVCCDILFFYPGQVWVGVFNIFLNNTTVFPLFVFTPFAEVVYIRIKKIGKGAFLCFCLCLPLLLFSLLLKVSLEIGR